MPRIDLLNEAEVRGAIYSKDMTDLLHKIYHHKAAHVCDNMILLIDIDVLVDNEDNTGSKISDDIYKLIEIAEDVNIDKSTYAYAEVQEAIWLKAFPKYSNI